jgi:DnaA family protein
LNPTQTLLPLLQAPAPTLASFVVGPNAEVLAAVRQLLAGEHDGEPVYLWGDHASGRSHLLRAAAVAQAGGEGGASGGGGVATVVPLSVLGSAALGEARALRDDHQAGGAQPVSPPDIGDDWSPTGPLLVVDDVDQLSPAAQVRVFDAINRGRAEGWKMLFAGPCPPARLSMRGELTSRLAQGLVLQLQHLTDAEKVAAMVDYAARAGFALPTDVADYLLRHGRRDLGTLLAVVQVIDQVSLRDHRPVSVRLARDVLTSADLFCPV